jgi:hypothetical protein
MAVAAASFRVGGLRYRQFGTGIGFIIFCTSYV